MGRWLVQRAGIHDVSKFSMRIEWEFTIDQVIVRDIAKGEEISRNRYTLDLTKDPKWITVTVVDLVKEIRPGIFQIVGDELQLKQEVMGGARPAGFPKNGYSVMKRQREKQPGPVQVTAKPVDKVPAEAQPPTPTSKDSQR